MKIKTFLLALVLVFLTACEGTPADVGDDDPVVPYDEIEPEPPEIIEPEEPEITGDPEPSPKIAVITSDFYLESDWLTALIKRHGAENVAVYTRLSWRSTDDEVAAWINKMAQNLELRVLIINPVGYRDEHIADTLHELRNDIFIAYTENSNDENANLILEVNHNQMAENFPVNAQKMGAETLIYFYNRYYDEHEESDQERAMREKSEEIGLRFVSENGSWAYICGSTTAMLMGEIIPPLIEEYGQNTVIFGLDYWRFFNIRRIYLPMYQAWFEPSPLNIARELSVVDYSERVDDIPFLIEGIRSVLEERNTLGRVASFPMPKQVLFTLAAVEYGLKWVEGEVPQEGIDIAVLEQIMLEILAEHTGLELGAELTARVRDGVTYENYILVLLDYLVYCNEISVLSAPKKTWVSAVQHIDLEFSGVIPDEVLEIYAPLLADAEAHGVTGEHNRIVVGQFWFYETEENKGFVTKGYTHPHGLNPSVFEEYYFDGSEYIRLNLSQGSRFGQGLTDGEFLYYMFDGFLHRLSKDGEIKTYLVFGEDDDKFLKGLHFLEGNGDEITVNPHYDLSQSVVVNINNLERN